MNGERKRKWKPLTILSGVGGLLFGGAAIMAYKKGYVRKPNPAVPIPGDISRVTLTTSTFELSAGDDCKTNAWSEYFLSGTKFRVWSILDQQEHPYRIFHVSIVEHILNEDGEENVFRKDPFYAIVGIPRYHRKSDLLDNIRRGSQIVFHLCLVGGSRNGIPTGDRILSRGKLCSWDFFERDQPLKENLIKHESPPSDDSVN